MDQIEPGRPVIALSDRVSYTSFMQDYLVFISDWAGYTDLYPAVSKRSDFLIPFAQHAEVDIRNRIDAGGGTLVGWSLGAHMILKRWQRAVEKFDRIILLAPFMAYADYASEDAISAMRTRLAGDADETVREYHRMCGLARSAGYRPEDAGRLVEGLEFMLTSRAMPSHRGGGKTTIIQGEYDRIIPPLAAEDIWEHMPDATHVALPCGHFIPESELVQLFDGTV